MKDLIKEGIIDASKVIKTSLINATSIATALLTTESVIYFEKEPIISSDLLTNK